MFDVQATILLFDIVVELYDNVWVSSIRRYADFAGAGPEVNVEHEQSYH